MGHPSQNRHLGWEFKSHQSHQLNLDTPKGETRKEREIGDPGWPAALCVTALRGRRDVHQKNLHIRDTKYPQWAPKYRDHPKPDPHAAACPANAWMPPCNSSCRWAPSAAKASPARAVPTLFGRQPMQTSTNPRDLPRIPRISRTISVGPKFWNLARIWIDVLSNVPSVST